jgi:LysR family transcriptional regulator (chromosome initiation inhibitor)
MATWVLPALAPLAGEYCFDLHREDQEHTSALLRAGTVMAAVTAEAEPVPGCTSTRSGGMRYRPMATRLRRRWFPDGPRPRRSPGRRSSSSTARTTCSTATCTRTGPDGRPAGALRAASADYVAAVGLGFGLGHGARPAGANRRAELVELDPDGAVDVVLYWQQWRLRSPSLDRVREAVLAAAGDLKR